MAKIYTKVNEMEFTIEETKTLHDKIDAKAQLELLAQQCSRIKSMIGQVKQQRDTVEKIVEWYNTWVDILNEAKENCHLAYKELDKIELPEGWTLDGLDPEKLPKIDVKRDEQVEQK